MTTRFIVSRLSGKFSHVAATNQTACDNLGTFNYSLSNVTLMRNLCILSIRIDLTVFPGQDVELALSKTARDNLLY
jgi:hypothetical protein